MPSSLGPSDNLVVDDIIVEHRQLRALVTRFEQEEAPSVLIDLWERLMAMLRSHFEKEEQLESTHQLTSSFPARYVAALPALAKEHRQLLDELEALGRLLRGHPMPPMGELRHRISAWVKQARLHEARENQLLMDAVAIDHGGG
jgi:hypothetical protein